MHTSENLRRHVITHKGVGTHIQTHFNNNVHLLHYHLWYYPFLLFIILSENYSVLSIIRRNGGEGLHG
jgi:hypothetical protein